MRADEVPHRMPDHEAASAAVTAAFSLLPYPITKDAAIEAVGGWSVPCDDGTRVPLAAMLAALPVDRFEDPAQAAEAVDRHWGDVTRTL